MNGRQLVTCVACALGVACAPDPLDGVSLRPGELAVLLLDMPVLQEAPMGESTLVVGPDGTLVLVDVGDVGHAAPVREMVKAVNGRLRSWPGQEGRSLLHVDWVVLTHFHSDHAGGLSRLLAGEEALQGLQGVVHRGYVDVGDALRGGADQGPVDGEPVQSAAQRTGVGTGSSVVLSPFLAACQALQARPELDVPLCTAPVPAPCAPERWAGTHAATRCTGLLRGDLSSPRDDADGTPSHIPLGDGARLWLLAADARTGDGSPLATFGWEHTNQENGRSVVMQLEHGPFRYHLGGDLSGSGLEDEPDVETPVVETLGARWWGTLGVDVVQAHHHAYNTSGNPRWVEALAPADGRTRTVVAGISAGHVGAPRTGRVQAWTGNGRLGEGRMWVTHVAPLGWWDPRVVDAHGVVAVETRDHGARYRVHGASVPWAAQEFTALRAVR